MSKISSRLIGAVGCIVALTTGEASAARSYALIVTGAHGQKQYEETYAKWRDALVGALRDLGVEPNHLLVLSDRRQDPTLVASADNVKKAFTTIRGSISSADLFIVVLIGHGTFDGVDAKFNLVGPDLEAAEWNALLKTIPAARTVLINTTAASAPFLERLSGPNRIVITATDSAAQRYETVFPEFLAAALKDPSSDSDKNGKVSVWEAFVYASSAVRRWYEQRGQLPTERALLDDDGDGVGRDAQVPAGTDGALAQITYLDAREPADNASDPALAVLLQKRRALEREIEELRVRKATMTPSDYEAQLEKLSIELALVNREIKAKS